MPIERDHSASAVASGPQEWVGNGGSAAITRQNFDFTIWGRVWHGEVYTLWVDDNPQVEVQFLTRSRDNALVVQRTFGLGAPRD